MHNDLKNVKFENTNHTIYFSYALLSINNFFLYFLDVFYYNWTKYKKNSLKIQLLDFLYKKKEYKKI